MSIMSQKVDIVTDSGGEAEASFKRQELTWRRSKELHHLVHSAVVIDWKVGKLLCQPRMTS